MKYAVFPVGSRPYCLWDPDADKDNRAFLQGIAYGYFSYIAQVHGPQLEGDQRQNAAIALRSAFHHGLETLFTLIGARIQAPHCVAAWILKCRTPDLRQFVQDVEAGAEMINEIGVNRVTWRSISDKLLVANFPSQAEATRVREGFAQLWSRFARDFLNETHAKEYNSLKHGLRVRPGGFSLGVANPAADGGPPPAEDYLSLGSSVYGSKFYDAVPIEGTDPNPSSRDPHFQFQSISLNWNADGVVAALEMISASIQNICANLRWWTGEPPETLPGLVAPDEEEFEKPWADSPTITLLRRNPTITENHIERLPDERLMEILRGRTRTSPEGAGADSPEAE